MWRDISWLMRPLESACAWLIWSGVSTKSSRPRVFFVPLDAEASTRWEASPVKNEKPNVSRADSKNPMKVFYDFEQNKFKTVFNFTMNQSHHFGVIFNFGKKQKSSTLFLGASVKGLLPSLGGGEPSETAPKVRLFDNTFLRQNLQFLILELRKQFFLTISMIFAWIWYSKM